jgi:hypothetical protein
MWCVALVRTDVSEECVASSISPRKIKKLRAPLVPTSKDVNVDPSSLIFSPWWWKQCFPVKHRFSQKPHDVTSQNKPFFIDLLFLTSMQNVFNYCHILRDSGRLKFALLSKNLFSITFLTLLDRSSAVLSLCIFGKTSNHISSHLGFSAGKGR